MAGVHSLVIQTAAFFSNDNTRQKWSTMIHCNYASILIITIIITFAWGCIKLCKLMICHNIVLGGCTSRTTFVNELLQLQCSLKFCLYEIIVVFKFMLFKGGSVTICRVAVAQCYSQVISTGRKNGFTLNFHWPNVMQKRTNSGAKMVYATVAPFYRSGSNLICKCHNGIYHLCSWLCNCLHLFTSHLLRANLA